jgi:hypothetical protein
MSDDFIERPNPPSHKWRWRPIIIGCVLAAVVYLIYFRSSPHSVQPALVENPGWDGLSMCSDAASLDGTKGLGLSSDGRAVLFDNTPIKDGQTVADHTTDGAWHFEGSGRYSLTFKGQTATYLIVWPEQTSICMLIRGSLDAADLSASWFSGAHNDEPAEDDAREDYRYRGD